MRKLVLIVPIVIGIVIFAAGCTATSVEENYENEIQLIDKEHARRPGEQGGGCKEE